LDPKYASPHRFLGNAYYGLKEYQKALAEQSEAIRLDPKYKKAYLDRAKVYRALGREAEAKADEEQAAKL
jgi:tetratricopeptide (TPR) repeat protein